MSALDVQGGWVDYRETYDEFERQELEEKAKKAAEDVETDEFE